MNQEQIPSFEDDLSPQQVQQELELLEWAQTMGIGQLPEGAIPLIANLKEVAEVHSSERRANLQEAHERLFTFPGVEQLLLLAQQEHGRRGEIAHKVGDTLIHFDGRVEAEPEIQEARKGFLRRIAAVFTQEMLAANGITNSSRYVADNNLQALAHTQENDQTAVSLNIYQTVGVPEFIALTQLTDTASFGTRGFQFVKKIGTAIGDINKKREQDPITIEAFLGTINTALAALDAQNLDNVEVPVAYPGTDAQLRLTNGNGHPGTTHELRTYLRGGGEGRLMSDFGNAITTDGAIIVPNSWRSDPIKRAKATELRAIRRTETLQVRADLVKVLKARRTTAENRLQQLEQERLLIKSLEQLKLALQKLEDKQTLLKKVETHNATITKNTALHAGKEELKTRKGRESKRLAFWRFRAKKDLENEQADLSRQMVALVVEVSHATDALAILNKSLEVHSQYESHPYHPTKTARVPTEYTVQEAERNYQEDLSKIERILPQAEEELATMITARQQANGHQASNGA